MFCVAGANTGFLSFFFFNFFLIGGKLLYNVMLVSAVQLHGSVIIIYIYVSLPS